MPLGYTQLELLLGGLDRYHLKVRAVHIGINYA